MGVAWKRGVLEAYEPRKGIKRNLQGDAGRPSLSELLEAHAELFVLSEWQLSRLPDSDRMKKA